MYTLLVSERDLNERRQRLTSRFVRFAQFIPHMQAIFDNIGTHKKAMSILQGQKGTLTYPNYRVILTKPHISFNYFEIWNLIASHEHKVSFVLEKAYLHFFLPKSPTKEEKLIFIHCDPQEEQESKHYRYKVAPHIHFEIAKDPWNGIHVPLCDGWQEKVLSNLEELDNAICRAVDFIVDQVFPALSI